MAGRENGRSTQYLGREPGEFPRDVVPFDPKVVRRPDTFLGSILERTHD